MEQKINENPKRELKGLNLFFCRIAGSDLDILSNYPHEISRHSRIGAIILSTALLASISMFFAIQTVTHSMIAGICIGLIWGLVIFVLDSFIVASYKKNDNKWTEFKIALPRIFLALILGCSISVPLELKIFENEILIEIEKMETKEETGAKILALEKYDKDVQIFRNERVKLSSENSTIKTELQPLKKMIYTLQDKLTLEINGKGITKKVGDGTTAKIYRDQLKSLEAELKNKIQEINPRITKNNSRILELDSLIASVPPPEDSTVELYGLGAQLEALSVLTKDNRFVFFAYWIFLLLVLSIETAPIFVKFFSQKGSYDIVLEMNEYIATFEQNKRKSIQHEQYKSEIKTFKQINMNKESAYEEVNKNLLKEIGKAQKAIGEKAIKLWKYEQFVKIDKNLNDFVKTKE